MKKSSAIKIIALALCALFLMQGTLAWQNIRQTATNEMYFESDYSPVRLVKMEKLPDGSLAEVPALLPGARFILRYYTGDSANPFGAPVYEDTVFTTDALGEIRLKDKLAPGMYIFEEISCPAGYTYDLDENGVEITGYVFEVRGDKTEVLVEAYNRRMTGALIIAKTVKTPDDSALSYEQTQQEFTFTLTFIPAPAETDVITYTITHADGTASEPLPLLPGEDGKYTVILRHGETAVINGIPTDTLYQVTETTAPGYITASTGTQGVITAEGARADFINTVYLDPSQTGELIVEKTVNPAPGNTGEQLEFKFYLELPPAEDGTRRFEEFTLRHGEQRRWTLPAGTIISVREVTTQPDYPEGYYPSVTQYTNVTIPAGGVVVLPFVNQHDPVETEPGSLRISKTVATPTDGSPQDTTAQFKFDVQFEGYPDPATVSPGYTIIRADGTQIGPTPFVFSPNKITITLRHGDAVIFNNIPHGVKYTVTEHKTQGFTADAESIFGFIAGGRTSRADFVNRADEELPPPPDQLHDLYVTKLLKGKYGDYDLTEEQKNKEFSFTLTLNPFTAEAAYDCTIMDIEGNTVKTDKLILDENGQARFTLKPGQTIKIAGIAQGTSYIIREDDYYTTEKYRPVVENFDGIMGSEDVIATITNIYEGEILIDIPGVKTWSRVPDEVTLPDIIWLQLMNGSLPMGDPIPVSPQNGKWEFIFRDVPKYDSEGNVILYAIKETPIPGFVAVQKEPTCDDEGNLTYHLENVYVPPVTTEDDPLTVEKIITVTEEGKTAPAEVFEFILSRRTPGAPMPGGVDTDQITITITGEGEATFAPITFTNPGTYVYIIEEKAGITPGWTYDHTVYTATYVVTFDEDDKELKVDLTIESDGGDKEDKAKFTNPFDPEEAAKYTSIGGKKTWDHKNNPVDKQPHSIRVSLLANGEVIDTVTVTAADNWEYLFINLPLHDEDTGAAITYTIEEERIPNYVPTITKTDHGYDIHNTYTPMVEVQVPLAVKKIQGTNPPAETFYFVLESIGGAPMPEGSEGSLKTMFITGAGTVNFGTIHYEKAGMYQYNIYERHGNAEGWMYDDSRYVLTVTVTEEADGLKAAAVLTRRNSNTALSQATFTNLYNKAGWDEKIVIEGSKYWDHGDNPKLMRPTSIRVFLYGNGQYVAEKLVTEADGWQYMFIVPRFTSDGDPITYVIDELEIEGYVKHVDGYDLFNTYVGDEPSATPRPPQLPSFSPATGDNSNLPLWIGIFAASFIGMGVLIAIIMRDKDRTSTKKHK